MKVWVTTVQFPSCDAEVLSVHDTWESAWAKLNIEFCKVDVCKGADGKCECDYDIKSPHYHGTAETPPPDKNWVQVAGPVDRKLFWRVDQFDIE